jgi:hypothetical protein
MKSFGISAMFYVLAGVWDETTVSHMVADQLSHGLNKISKYNSI